MRTIAGIAPEDNRIPAIRSLRCGVNRPDRVKKPASGGRLPRMTLPGDRHGRSDRRIESAARRRERGARHGGPRSFGPASGRTAGIALAGSRRSRPPAPALGAALDLLKRAAPSRLPVLIQGESGSGKEVAARAVHELSSRAAGPFVPVNCGAIAAEVAEAELFGHERGAFTGAVQSSIGAFGAAESGTLFLDEIGDLPLALQVKLLRALESGEVKPVGAPRPRRMDVRVVCATHRDLRAEVRRGAFREDLYYRLCGVVVRLPP